MSSSIYNRHVSYSDDVTDEQTTPDPIEALGILAEPTRRELYAHVAAADAPVARDEAAAAVGIGVRLAAFHLDRLVEAGLLEAEYRRRGERRGPGAGRPAKLYRRAARTVEVSLPARRYELAATLLADAVTAMGPAALGALREVARARGRAIARVVLRPGEGAGQRERDGEPPPEAAHSPVGEGAERGPDPVVAVLAAGGFEPAEDAASGVIRLRNCPFDGLAREHGGIACPMNVALLEGVAEEVGGVIAVPDETPGYCCVALQRTAPGA